MTHPTTAAHSHEHTHVGHTHGHDEAGHEHGLEGYHVNGGAPALNIGGDIGALVALMDSSALGTELHLQLRTDPTRDVHTGVWERRMGSDTLVAAVFAELEQGTYDVLDTSGAAVQLVEIEGGAVAEIDLRT